MMTVALRRRQAVLPADLGLAVCLMVAATMAAWLHGPEGLRVPLGLAAVLFLPGFALSKALFPGDVDLSRSERLGLSIGLSLVIVVFVALTLSYTGSGVSFGPIVWAVTGVMLVSTAAAAVRYRLSAAPMEERSQPSWPGARTVGLAAIALAVLSVAVTLFALVLSQTRSRYTEFYVLGPGGHVQNYPTSVQQGRQLQLSVGVTNEEARASRYHIAVRSGGVDLAVTPAFELAAGQARQQQIDFAVTTPPGVQKLQLLLYQQAATSPYRTLTLWVTVTGP